MDLNKLNNFDLLKFHNIETGKLKSLCNETTSFGGEIETTCKNVIGSGIKIINKFHNIIKSFSQSSLESIDKHFLYSVSWQFSEILKSSRFCLEALIWILESGECSLNTDLDRYALTGLLCKILIFQGDFLELCVHIEKLIYSDSENERRKLRKSFSHIFEFLRKWEIYRTDNDVSMKFCHGINELKRENFMKDVKLKILNSFLFDENIFDKRIDNLFTIFEELYISNLQLNSISNTSVDNDKFNIIKKVTIFRLFHRKDKCICHIQFQPTDLTHKQLLNHKESDETTTNEDKYDILDVMYTICNNLSIHTSLNSEQFENIFELIPSVLSTTHSDNKMTSDKRKRNKSVGETMNLLTYGKKHGHENLELDLSLIIINVVDSHVGTPNFKDKQYRTWIQMIPFYCYNLILSILGKDEMKCDDFFSLNLISNLPSTEQFDELIAKEVSKLSLTKTNNSKLIDLLPNFFSSLSELSLNSKLLVLELSSIAKNFKININIVNIGEVLLKVSDYLLNLNLLVNRFTKDYNTNNTEMLEKVINILFTHIKHLHLYCTCLIRYLVFNKMDNCTTAKKNSECNGNPDVFFALPTNNHNQWGYFAYKILGFCVKSDVRILSFFHSLLKALVSFHIVLSNMLNYSFDNNIKLLSRIIERDFELILDLFAIYRENFNFLYSEDLFPTKILYILFILAKIRHIKFYYKEFFYIIFEGVIFNLKEYLGIINIAINCSDTYKQNSYEKNENSSISNLLFSNRNLVHIFEKMITWNLILNIDNSKLELSDSADKCLRYLEISTLEYQLSLRMDSSNEIGFGISYNLFLHNVNSFFEAYFGLNLRFSNDRIPNFYLFERFEIINDAIFEVLGKESNEMLSNSTILISIINKFSYFFSTIARNKTEIITSNLTININEKLLNIIILIISRIHGLFIFHLTNNKTNILLIRCLMVFLLTIFDFYQLTTSIIEPSIIINLFRYLIYLEFALGLQTDDGKDIKCSAINDHTVILKHVLSNYCSFYKFIDNKTIKIHEHLIYGESVNKTISLLLKMTNVKQHLIFFFIKYGLIYHFSSSMNDWFIEINSFINEYTKTTCKSNINNLLRECNQLKKRFGKYFDHSKFIISNKNKYNLKFEDTFVLPEHETEYLELFGILLQLIYGIPVCPLPIEPFNKLVIYNQSHVFSNIKKVYLDLKAEPIYENSSINIYSLIDFSISNEINIEKENDEIFGFLTPTSPILSLCCNVFDFLIGCTSLTEKQYSDSKVSFYSSFIELIEELYFYSKFSVDNSPIESNFFWNIVSSPIIFPAFMEHLYTENKNEYTGSFNALNLANQNDLSSLLFNSCISDTILNFYDNIFALPTNFEYTEIEKLDNSTLKIDSNYEDESMVIPLIFFETHSKKLFVLSLETILFCKYYLAYFLNEFMQHDLDFNFLLGKKQYDGYLNALNGKVSNYITNEDYLYSIITCDFNNKKKKYNPLSFLTNCFISCIPAMYVCRDSNSWYPGKFGNSYHCSIFHGSSSSSSIKNLRTLFVYLKWLNMNLFFIDYFEIKLITTCINILKLLVSEYDDRDSLELMFNTQYSSILKMIISQVVLLLEIEDIYYSNLFNIKANDSKYSIKEIDLLLAINFDNLCIRMVNIKGVYSNMNVKYLLLKNYILYETTEMKENLEVKYYNDRLLLSCIASILKVRKKMFMIFFPFLSSINVEWCNINFAYFEKINNAIWIPSYLESKCRFKLAKIQIYSYFHCTNMDNCRLDLTVREIIIAYSLSIESLLLCYLSLNGISTEVPDFLTCVKLFLTENSHMPLINFYKKREILIYKVINEIFLNKFPSYHPFSGKINSCQNTPFLKSSISNSNNNIINHLHYFYRSFSNLQSIKQFALLLIINKNRFQLSEYLISTLLETLCFNSIDATCIDETSKDIFISELIFDDIDTNQSIIKKNKLVQASLSPYVIQLQPFFSLINFIILKKNSLELISYYQRIFMSNKRVLPFYGVDNSKLLNDHYNGLYLRRNRKHINSRLRFIKILNSILLVSKGEIYSNISSVKVEFTNSDVLLYVNNKYLSPNHLERGYMGIYLCVYSSQLKNIHINVPKKLMEITYCYLESINLIFEQLIDIIFNEMKTVRQLSTIDLFEYEISDRIKSINKKGNESKICILKSVDWNDVCQHGQFNISLKVIRDCLSEVFELLNFVISLNFPIDGRFLSNTFGLVFLFNKYDICLIQSINESKSEYVIKNVHNISHTVLKQLEKHFGSIVLNSIPFSLINDTFHFKPLLEEAFLTLFNRNFLITINLHEKYTRLEIMDLINLIFEFVGMNPIFNTTSSNQNIRSKSSYYNITSTEKLSSNKKRRTESINTLFNEDDI
ncbi:hypothetical protein FG379_001042 [Cryptosporidium bovis]|uniref:uncharacterized protein n=1 Tax=Cryptosporidium bovis TaxID=310047 RepID=UPI00351A9DA0|nr:hypothetical protein FG379_001042 [Cryptosporidium bovis]